MVKNLNVNLFRNSNFLMFLKFMISLKICNSFFEVYKNSKKELHHSV